MKQYDEAFEGLKALLDEAAAAALYNNLGVVQLRRGATPQTGRATYFFNQAAEAEPEDPDYAFNLGYAYWFERDPQAAVYWLKEAVRRNPADGDAHYVIGVALQSTGAQVEAEREKELARQLSSKYREWERRPPPAGEPVPRGLERAARRTGHPAPVARGRDARAGRAEGPAGTGRVSPGPRDAGCSSSTRTARRSTS